MNRRCDLMAAVSMASNTRPTAVAINGAAAPSTPKTVDNPEDTPDRVLAAGPAIVAISDMGTVTAVAAGATRPRAWASPCKPDTASDVNDGSPANSATTE